MTRCMPYISADQYSQWTTEGTKLIQKPPSQPAKTNPPTHKPWSQTTNPTPSTQTRPKPPHSQPKPALKPSHSQPHRPAQTSTNQSPDTATPTPKPAHLSTQTPRPLEFRATTAQRNQHQISLHHSTALITKTANPRLGWLRATNTQQTSATHNKCQTHRVRP